MVFVTKLSVESLYKIALAEFCFGLQMVHVAVDRNSKGEIKWEVFLPTAGVCVGR
jgi:hypothetical protein